MHCVHPLSARFGIISSFMPYFFFLDLALELDAFARVLASVGVRSLCNCHSRIG
ncbi:hypothetical protein K445DRAFT_226545 [Daldinia sp. EC12]|nr:hypothetical protein K445DRAFT_226545 [Daldinia sp. EC12]